MKETIFYLEGRGGMWIYHFFGYNLGGLFYIINNIFDKRGKPNTSVLLDDKSKIVEVPTSEIKFPIKIHMKDVLPFQREAFEIIKDKFELIEDLNSIPDYEIVSIYGETCDNNSYADNAINIFPFLRQIFLNRVNYEVIQGKRIFITRKNSGLQHNGIIERCILNESEMENILNKYNIQYIKLEDYSIHDKIKLFMESELILSTHGSQLTFTLFSNKKTKIIEILNRGKNGCANDHIINICNTLGLNYNRYSDINEDNNGNFNLELDKFENFLNNFI
jgi:DNA-directed RNA polymerase subunit H (RpoH/RPB5)